MSSPATLVSRVDFITVPAVDLDVSRRFYAEVLGLRCSAVWQRGDSPPRGAEYETGNLTIAVVDPVSIGRHVSPHANPIALRVDDVDAARIELESRGVTFGGPTIDSGVCHMAFFADPAGNALMLHRRYAPQD